MMARLLESVGIQNVRLVARDPGRMSRFYTDLLGFVIHRSHATEITLGSGSGEGFLTLEVDGSANPRPASAPGLFHVAYLYKGRRELGSVLRHLTERKTTLEGFADHRVSEAIYLRDPEGNGVELYRDRPRAEWPYRNGELVMSTDPLDVESLYNEQPLAPRTENEGLRIGHVHLQTSSLQAAEHFWVDTLGFDVVQRSFPGALFVSAGGYHHHIGLNTWRSRGQSLPRGRWTGLSAITLSIPDRLELGRMRERVAQPEMQQSDEARAIFEETDVLFSLSQ